MVLSYLTVACYKISVASFRPASPIRSIVADCLAGHTFVCERLLSYVLNGRNLVYILLESSANGYPSCY